MNKTASKKCGTSAKKANNDKSAKSTEQKKECGKRIDLVNYQHQETRRDTAST